LRDYEQEARVATVESEGRSPARKSDIVLLPRNSSSEYHNARSMISSIVDTVARDSTMTNYQLNLTNNSRVPLYAFGVTPTGTEVTLTSSLVEIPAGATVQIASFDPPHTDSWGWVSVGLANGDCAYQIYCERTYDGYHKYAQFGYYNADNSEPDSNKSPFPDGVSTWSLESESYDYTFNGMTVPYQLALGPFLAGDGHVWQFFDSANQKWVPLMGVIVEPPSEPPTSCGLDVDGVTTTLALTIQNSTGRAFTVNITQDGVLKWTETVYLSIKVLVDLPMTSGASSVLEIRGQYSDDGTQVLPLNALPDPKFTITRQKGG
jgi:hypothetical protein